MIKEAPRVCKCVSGIVLRGRIQRTDRSQEAISSVNAAKKAGKQINDPNQMVDKFCNFDKGSSVLYDAPLTARPKWDDAEHAPISMDEKTQRDKEVRATKPGREASKDVLNAPSGKPGDVCLRVRMMMIKVSSRP